MMLRHDKTFLMLLGALLCATLLAANRPAIDTHAANTALRASHAVPLYRLYSPGAIDHFYTTNAAERDHAEQNLGYHGEGTAACIWPTSTNRIPLVPLVPLYRLYSPGATDHFYTTNTAERDHAIHTLGYHDEGITGDVANHPVANLIPLYRLYSPTGTDHFYTTNATERDHAIHTLGYHDEGIAAWVLPSSAC
jgi:hypothetical protein